MRKVAFVRRRSDRWEQLETMLREESPDPETLADLYVELTDDLAYARTHYPGSDTVQYLNDLAKTVHRSIYRGRREDKGRILRFWTTEVPQAVWASRKELGISAAAFLLSLLVGAVSTYYDASFARLILGDAYVNQTLANIDAGDPMAVYKKMREFDMFFSIAVNNVRVAFYAFTMGVFAGLGTAYILVSNGIMIGTFHMLFAQQNLLDAFLPVVYIHGTLELSAIIIAGAAGLTFGRGLVFPGARSRRTTFVEGARRGLKIVIGLVPVFVVAAFLEGFVTRYTNMPLPLSLTVIGLSLAFVGWYFVWRPIQVGTGASFSESSSAPSSASTPRASARSVSS